MFIGAHEAEYMFVTTLLKIEQHLLAQGRCPYKLFSCKNTIFQPRPQNYLVISMNNQDTKQSTTNLAEPPNIVDLYFLYPTQKPNEKGACTAPFSIVSLDAVMG